MTDLDERFLSFSRTTTPDLWRDIEHREPRRGPELPARHRALAIAVAFIVAALGIGAAAITFGGSERRAATAASGRHGVEASNGSIAFTRGVGSYHIAAVGLDGTIRDLSSPTGGDFDLGPRWSPDGRRLAFLRYTRGDYELVVANADGSGVVGMGQPAEDFTWAPDGQTIAFPSFRPGSDVDILIADVDGGGQRELVTSPLTDTEPAWSPNGDEIAFVSHPVLDRDPGDADIFVVRPDGTGLTKLTNGPAWDSSPEWSPDGRHIAFISQRDGESEIYVMNADGSAPARITESPGDVSSFKWSPDGTQLAFVVYSGRSWDILMVNADGTGQKAIADSPQDETGPEWSPDGTQIAYAVAESSESCRCDNAGSFEIYVMNPDGTGKVRLTNGAHELGGGLSWQAIRGSETSPP